MSSEGAVPIKTKPSTAAVGKAEAEIQAKQANVKDLKNIDIDSQHLNYEISSIPRESWWKTEEKDVNNDLSHSMSVFPSGYLPGWSPSFPKGHEKWWWSSHLPGDLRNEGDQGGWW